MAMSAYSDSTTGVSFSLTCSCCAAASCATSSLLATRQSATASETPALGLLLPVPTATASAVVATDTPATGAAYIIDTGSPANNIPVNTIPVALSVLLFMNASNGFITNLLHLLHGYYNKASI